jgi:hypothetical protein
MEGPTGHMETHVHPDSRFTCVLGLPQAVVLQKYIILVRTHWASYGAQGSVGFLRRPYTPLATSTQAALAPHQTTDQEKSVDTTFMVM